jgi:hypothetical protein
MAPMAEVAYAGYAWQSLLKESGDKYVYGELGSEVG